MFSSEFTLFVRAMGHEYSKLKVLFGSKLMQPSPKWAQNWPFCFFKKIYPIPFSCFWHEVGKPGLFENPMYLLVFVWSSQLPSQIWLEKRLLFLTFCMTLGNYLKLFGTMITQIYWIFFLSNLFAQNRGKSDSKMTCWTLLKVGETGNLRLENGLFTFWRSVKVAVPVVGPGHCRSPQQVPSRFIKKSSLKLYCLK